MGLGGLAGGQRKLIGPRWYRRLSSGVDGERHTTFPHQGLARWDRAPKPLRVGMMGSLAHYRRERADLTGKARRRWGERGELGCRQGDSERRDARTSARPHCSRHRRRRCRTRRSRRRGLRHVRPCLVDPLRSPPHNGRPTLAAAAMLAHLPVQASCRTAA